MRLAREKLDISLEERSRALLSDLESIRNSSPLIHNITNYVVMDFSANALLALGASPVMAHALEEVEEMTQLSSALVLNIGTLSPYWVESMRMALEVAQKKKIPIVFDPVGCGATSYRTETSKQFLKLHPTVVRGNISEIFSLLDDNDKGQGNKEDCQTKGVDSRLFVEDEDEMESTVKALQAKASKQKSIFAMTGSTDCVFDTKKAFFVKNGHPLMKQVTGMGCVLTSFVAAFCSVNPDSLLATVNALSFFGILGEKAAKKASGLASFKTEFLNSVEKVQDLDLPSFLNMSERTFN